jgi:hypothetical protein
MLAIPDLLRARTLLQPGTAADAFYNIFEVREERARCVAPAPLAAKYGACGFAQAGQGACATT